MKKRKTKKQKIAARARPQVAVSPSITPVSTGIRVNKKSFLQVDTGFIKKDLLKSLVITGLMLILLFGIKWYLG